MSLNGILDVAIVLAAVYVTLSCFCSWANEQIASVFRLRGQYLYAGVLNLVLGERGLVDAVYAHPFVTSMSRDPDGKPRGDAAVAGTARVARGVLAPLQSLLRSVGGYRPSYLPAPTFALAFWQCVREAASASGADAPRPADAAAAVWGDVTRGVDAIQNPDLARVLRLLLERANGDYDALLRVTGDWFDAQMDHVSGWYRRKTQWIVVTIAFVVVTMLGVDSLAIIRTLSADPAVADQATARIASSLSMGGSAPATLDARLREMRQFAQAMRADAGADDGNLWNAVAALPCANRPACNVADVLADRAAVWRRSAAGLLLTIAALSLGGPFWFDVLRTLVNVRASGPAPRGKR